MKKYLVNYYSLFIILIFSFLFVSCEKKETVTIDKIPRVEYYLFDDEPVIYTYKEIKESMDSFFEDIGLQWVEYDISDSAYVVPDHEWMISYLDWFEKLAWQIGLEYGKDKFDCENYADLLTNLAHVSSSLTYRSIDAQILIGTISVRQINEFGGIPATGGFHRLNFFVTGEGIFVLEPQSNTVVKYKDYPNLEYVYKVRFN